MREDAAAIGTDALIWLAGRPEELAALLAVSGLDAAALRARAGEPAFLGFVLDFVLAEAGRRPARASGAARRRRARLDLIQGHGRPRQGLADGA